MINDIFGNIGEKKQANAGMDLNHKPELKKIYGFRLTFLLCLINRLGN